MELTISTYLKTAAWGGNCCCCCYTCRSPGTPTLVHRTHPESHHNAVIGTLPRGSMMKTVIIILCGNAMRNRKHFSLTETFPSISQVSVGIGTTHETPAEANTVTRDRTSWWFNSGGEYPAIRMGTVFNTSQRRTDGSVRRYCCLHHNFAL